MGYVRKILLFVIAVAMVVGGLLVADFGIEAPTMARRGLFIAGGAMVAFLGLYLLWEDFFRKKQAPEAYKLGQRAADGMVADLDRFMRLRFDPVRANYLKVLRDGFDRSFDPPEAPPMIMARIEYNSFLENVDVLLQKMPPEITTAMREWRDLSDKMGLGARAQFNQIVNHRVETFMSNLRSSGLQMFLDLADGLKAADDRWRAAHPEMSAQFPPD